MLDKSNSHAGVDPGELAGDAVLGAEEETSRDGRQQHAHGQVRDEGTLVREPDLGLDLDGGGLLLCDGQLSTSEGR